MNDQQQIEQIKAEIQELILKMVRYALVESTDEYSLRVEVHPKFKCISVFKYIGDEYKFIERNTLRPPLTYMSDTLYIQPSNYWISFAERWSETKDILLSIYSEMQEFIDEQKQVAS